MGWFNDQIKERKKLDDEVFSDSFIQMAGAILGGRVFSILSENSIRVKGAIDEILKYYHVKSRDVPDSITDVNEQLEYLLRPYGIMRRTVELEKGWYRDAIGALLAVRKEDQTVVAMIPSGFSGYSFTDPDTGKRVRVNNFNEDQFEKDALAFYKPFPLKKLHITDLFAYMLENLSFADLALFALASFIVVYIGMLLPQFNGILFGEVIARGSKPLLWTVTAFFVCVTISNLLFGSIKSLFEARINTKLSISVDAASMMRVLSLPAPFFNQYSSGELSSRLSYVSSLCTMLVSSLLSGLLTSLFSLVYLKSIQDFARGLVIPAIIIMVVSAAFSVISTFARMKISRQQLEVSAKESGMSYALISGVQKIKLSGSEKRAFSRWGNLYAKDAQLTYNPPAFIKINSAIATGITLLGTILLYDRAIKTGVSVSGYTAFLSAYGMLSGAFTGLTSLTANIAQIKPVLEMAKPILETVPEVSEGKQVITKISGAIELNNVSFRYNDGGPNIVDDMSLKIRPGEYVAIVGKTGCGKSTLMRLLLGFEKAQSGAIYFDGKDIDTIDLKSLRRKIGVVMQEGKLFQGDIFSNIVISAPWLTLDDAWEAAEMSGIADDIRRMPMGMHTIISEGSGGISGGQRQRLMIARAIAPKPKILMFDEATSALDNITQRTVAESLDSLKCTRIVIAHRLSTVRNCDRILCLDGGRIIEEGTYDELIKKKGFFAELVARQRINPDAE